MPKRFGRNQRRAMREESEALRDQLAEQAIRHLGERERAAKAAREAAQRELLVREWAERIVAILGPDSAFTREPSRHRLDRRMFDALVNGRIPYRLSDDQPLNPFTVEAMPMYKAMSVIELFAIHASADDDDIRMRRRVLIQSPEGDLAYEIDRLTLERMRAAGRMDEPLRYVFEKLERAWKGLDPVPGYPRRAQKKAGMNPAS